MSPIKMSKLKSAIRTGLAYHEAFNRQDLAGMIVLLADDCLFEHASPAPDGTRMEGKEVITQFWTGFFGSSPGGRNEIEDVFGMGERCVIHWRHSGIGKAGETMHLRGVTIFRVRDGLIGEIRSYIKGG